MPPIGRACFAAELMAQPTRGENRLLCIHGPGSGTYDDSLLTSDNGVPEGVATVGGTHAGGEDFDRRAMQHAIGTFNGKPRKDWGEDNRSLRELRREGGDEKRALSSSH